MGGPAAPPAPRGHGDPRGVPGRGRRVPNNREALGPCRGGSVGCVPPHTLGWPRAPPGCPHRGHCQPLPPPTGPGGALGPLVWGQAGAVPSPPAPGWDDARCPRPGHVPYRTAPAPGAARTPPGRRAPPPPPPQPPVTRLCVRGTPNKWFWSAGVGGAPGPPTAPPPDPAGTGDPRLPAQRGGTAVPPEAGASPAGEIYGGSLGPGPLPTARGRQGGPGRGSQVSAAGGGGAQGPHRPVPPNPADGGSRGGGPSRSPESMGALCGGFT